MHPCNCYLACRSGSPDWRLFALSCACTSIERAHGRGVLCLWQGFHRNRFRLRIEVQIIRAGKGRALPCMHVGSSDNGLASDLYRRRAFCSFRLRVAVAVSLGASHAVCVDISAAPRPTSRLTGSGQRTDHGNTSLPSIDLCAVTV